MCREVSAGIPVRRRVDHTAPVAPLLFLLAAAPQPTTPAVDVHVHLAPSEHARAARHFDAAGVDWVLNLSGGWPGGRLETQLAAARETGRALTAVTLPWRASSHPKFSEVAVKILKSAAEAGARALKIEKALGLGAPDLDGSRLPVDSPRLDPIWAAAGALGLPVFIHTGDPEAFWDPVDENNPRFEELSVHPGWSNHEVPGLPDFDALLSELERVVARHPETTFVSVHFGNHAEDPEAVGRQLERYPNLYVDLAARIVELGRSEPARVARVLDRHRSRVLFGTDLGLWPRGGVMLGSTGEEPDEDTGVVPYYRAHWTWLQTTESQPSPVPIQGRHRLEGVRLKPRQLAPIYAGNAEMLLAPPPWGSKAAERYPPYFRL